MHKNIRDLKSKIKIYIADEEKELPIEEALNIIDDAFILDGQCCPQTILDLKDACTTLLGAFEHLYENKTM